VRITTPSASAEIYLHGAQVTSWIPAGQEDVIFLSGEAKFQDGKAIRGGIPVCLPWFNAKTDNPKAPSHGFVRTKAWQLESILHNGDNVAVTLSTGNDDVNRQWFPYDFQATLRVTVGSELKLELEMTNTSAEDFTFEEALHTYYTVGDIKTIHIAGLDGVTYLDNTEGNREKIQEGEITFTKPTDNAYQNTSHSVELTDPSLQRRLLITKENSVNTVVWNPWQAGAESFADLGDAEWEQMVCIEGANIRKYALTLPAGERHTISITTRVEKL
jgi:glucose-6-phosphate 1-epimerase